MSAAGRRSAGRSGRRPERHEPAGAAFYRGYTESEIREFIRLCTLFCLKVRRPPNAVEINVMIIQACALAGAAAQLA